MKNVALILRSTTDFAYVLHIIVRLQSASKMAQQLKLSIWKGFPWLYLVTDILAILPFPQVREPSSASFSFLFLPTISSFRSNYYLQWLYRSKLLQPCNI